MTHTTTDTEHFYCRSMGKLLRVVAIADSDEAANDYVSRHDNAAVIACMGRFVLMADKWDKGEQPS